MCGVLSCFGVVSSPYQVRPPLTVKDLLLRTLPLSITILVLLITRIQQLKIKGIFQR
jgi:hypothetical protein